jgi:hypothetical protein
MVLLASWMCTLGKILAPNLMGEGGNCQAFLRLILHQDRLFMGGHVYSTLNSHLFMIAEPSGAINLDEIMLIVGGHVYSTLNSTPVCSSSPSLPASQILMS